MTEPNALALRFQYANAEQQRVTASVGMWVFLATEVMFFGGLFTAYAVYRMYYPQAFLAGSHLMETACGAINTFVLLTSSFTMALAVHSASTSRQTALRVFLLLTILLGSLFLGIKFYEYYQHYQDHKVPGVWWEYSGPAPSGHVEMFFLFYFLMTGLHAVHMTIGLGLVGLLLVRSLLFETFAARYHTPVENIGLYWHFVDVIWIFLYPLFYLIDLYKVVGTHG